MAIKTYFREFIKQCLFFNSSETINWFFGICGWGSLTMFGYAVYRVVECYQ